MNISNTKPFAEPIQFGVFQEKPQKAAPWASQGLKDHYENVVKPLAEELDKALAEKGFEIGPDKNITMVIEWPFNQVKITPKTMSEEAVLMKALKELGCVEPRNNQCMFRGVLVVVTSQQTYDYVDSIERRLRKIGKL
jgi:hypothetical protein